MAIPTTTLRLENGTQLEGVEASGLVLRPQSDGTLRACMDQIVMRGVRLRSPAGEASVAKITLTDAELSLAGAVSSSSFDLRGLGARQVDLEGVELVPAPAAATASPGHLRLDPIGAMQGMLQVCIRDALWVVDAEITLPITGGRLDFNRVTVEHIGPDSSMGIGPNSIYVDAPNFGRTDLYRFRVAQVPGARHERRGGFNERVTDRGSLDLQAFAEAMLAAGPSGAPGGIAGPDVEAMLDRTKMSGELRLGDGVVGSERGQLVLAGQAEGKNRISLSAAVLGQRLVLRMPAASASRAAFELFGMVGSTGPVSATLEAHVTGLGARTTDTEPVSITVLHLCARQLVLGTLAEPVSPAS